MKKNLFIIIGIGIILVTSGLAQFHEITYPGAAFYGRSPLTVYYIDGYLHMGEEGTCYSAVNFPDSANGMKVSRISMIFMDNNNQAEIRLQLLKLDRWTGVSTEVAHLYSYLKPNSSSIQYMNLPKSGMRAQGIDNNRYSWYLRAMFDTDASVLNLRLYSVIIRYE